MNPLITAVMAAGWLGEGLGPRRAAGIAIALAGVVTIVVRDGALAGGPLVGDLLALAAAFAWAVYSVLGKPLLATRRPFEVTTLAMVVGAVALLPLGLPGLVAVPWTRLGPSTWLQLAYISVLTQVVAYLLWYWTLARASTARVVAFTYLTPLIATAISIATGHEVVSGTLIAGALAVLGGVALAQFR
jgi:drug/metabolite transporter (DMT)-like permease